MNFRKLFGGSRTAKIFGAKDYLVIIEGDVPCDAGNELNALTHPSLREHGYFGVLHFKAADHPGIHVHPIYDGSWSFAVSPAEEDGTLPPWAIRRAWGTVNAHSETLEIDLPADAHIEVLAPVESQPKQAHE